MVADELGAESVTAGEVPRSYWPDVLGVLWVLAAAFVSLVPALVRGQYLGSFDLLSQYGLTSQPGLPIHNAVTADISDEVVPWIQAAWIQVHHGHVPLWIHNEALGMPLAFNFGSGAFSLPALVSYLTPLRFVLWVQVLVSLTVGGTGAYFFGRVLRLHPVACAFAGTTWVLSGPFWGYLGLPDTSVMSWAGWQFAAVVLILRGSHRFRAVVLFAVAFAFSMFAGNPQIEVIIVLPLVVFVVVVLLWRHVVIRSGGPIRRPIVDLAAAGIAGTALSAPLLLPGLQLANASVRTVAPNISREPTLSSARSYIPELLGATTPGQFRKFAGLFRRAVGVRRRHCAGTRGGRGRRALAATEAGPEVVGLAAGAVVALLGECLPNSRQCPEQIAGGRPLVVASIADSCGVLRCNARWRGA